MITYRQVDQTMFPSYDAIPMDFSEHRVYQIQKLDRGLGGFLLAETEVPPFYKDFRVAGEAGPTQWAAQFDLSHWCFFMAFDDARPVGAAAVAMRTPGMDLLAGRDDLAVLWDLRVEEPFRRQGIGQTLFRLSADRARQLGCSQLKIECQNNNVPAVRFYHGQGAVLSAVDEYAYYHEPACRHEAQLIWYLDL